MRRVKRYSEEQIERANRVNVVEYAKSQGLEIQKSGNWYKAKHMGGLYFNVKGNTWHWETRNAGGQGAISLCMEYENIPWKEAVKKLLNEEMDEMRYQKDWTPEKEEEKEFILPEKNDTYKHVIAYLTKTRGIDYDLVKEMIKMGFLYENKHRSCVFVGFDEDGVAKHASIRSTNTVGTTFKQDVAGSKKEYSFSISGSNEILNVSEAPIDVLSYMTLQKINHIERADSYVSLGGVTNKALEEFLKKHPNIKKIRVCTDHDIAGEECANRIFQQYSSQYKVTRHKPKKKDFNEDLIEEREIECLKKTKALEEIGIKKDQIIDQKNLYHIKGTCGVLIICKNQDEVISHAVLQVRNMKVFFDLEYVPDEHYLSYSNEEQIKKILKDYPNIDQIRVCMQDTKEGKEIKEHIKKVFEDQYRINLEKPVLATYEEDLKESIMTEKAMQCEIPNTEIVSILEP